MTKQYGSTFKIDRVRAIFVQMVKNSDFGYIGRYSAHFCRWILKPSTFAYFRAIGLIHFTSGHISIIVLLCNCKHLTLDPIKRKKIAKLKITGKKLPFLNLIFGNPFFTTMFYNTLDHLGIHCHPLEIARTGKNTLVTSGSNRNTLTK